MLDCVGKEFRFRFRSGVFTCTRLQPRSSYHDTRELTEMTLMRILFCLLALLLLAAPLAADELTTTDGDKLVGKFVKLEGGEVYFNTNSSGEVKVPAGKVAGVVLDEERDARLRREGDIKSQEEVKILSIDGKLYFRDKDGEQLVDLATVQGIDEAVPDERPLWDVSALAVFSWTEGNTRTYSLGYRFDIKRTTKHNFMTLFGRGSYFQDRELPEDSVRERKHHFGYHYRYIFDFNLTIDATEDLYFNEFAGYHWRSITGVGPGYYLLRQEKLTWHVGAHLTYTYEDQIAGAEDRGYFGARVMTEFDWKSANDMFHVNYKGELLFDFDESKNVTGNQSLLLEHKFLSYFTAGLLIEHAWDNLPPPKFKHHDFRLSLAIGFSWGARGF